MKLARLNSDSLIPRFYRLAVINTLSVSIHRSVVSRQLSVVSGQPSAVRGQCSTDVTQIRQMVTCFIQKLRAES
ncbi:MULTISPECIES: hypothetical protein [Moorena]|uniref:hypothetical protein n=1 Tax=Moorena TaxID=1155738 RepID=UPI0010543499|nr:MULTISPECIES: hypothetical protein [Moorena]NEP30106.1 hypothetical protein [Moorena sp. SIO3B2]NEP65055.1 hypothetical protein [Moorena sp. SIO3A5]NEQ06725.1 hypothetical protein [Moorena sp. SIO4E2]NER91363.1 hypothetical protein [Moorena sp. SIO3A2]NET65012.1 hypothetical protein [Moorena sp. SIO1G6]